MDFLKLPISEARRAQSTAGDEKLFRSAGSLVPAQVGAISG